MSIRIEHCKGCHDDYYNHSEKGGCWSRKSGTMVKRIPVGMQEPPPYKGRKLVSVPDCWHGSGPYRTIYVKLEALTAEGYWKG